MKSLMELSDCTPVPKFKTEEERREWGKRMYGECPETLVTLKKENNKNNESKT